MQGSLEWDSMVSKATAAYNFFPTQSSKHAPFFLMFGREAAVKHMILASESPKYLGMDEGTIKREIITETLSHCRIQLSYDQNSKRHRQHQTTTRNTAKEQMY